MPADSSGEPLAQPAIGLSDPLIFDSSALFNFGHRGNLDRLLGHLAGNYSLLIPSVVKDEVSLKTPAFYQSLIERYFEIREPNPGEQWRDALDQFAREVGSGGELNVVALAMETSGTVVMDERAGRTKARAFGLAVTGTIGLLDYALKSEWIDEREALEIAGDCKPPASVSRLPRHPCPGWIICSVSIGASSNKDTKIGFDPGSCSGQIN